ncbi:hypothetical protein GYH30_024742 [Glycine max]|nr:hypothetical protein GYH30_024742 [Glycine max]
MIKPDCGGVSEVCGCAVVLIAARVLRPSAMQRTFSARRELQKRWEPCPPPQVATVDEAPTVQTVDASLLPSE